MDEQLILTKGHTRNLNCVRGPPTRFQYKMLQMKYFQYLVLNLWRFCETDITYPDSCISEDVKFDIKSLLVCFSSASNASDSFA